MAAAGLFALAALLAALAPFALYYLVRTEQGQREPMDRETAEQTARRGTQAPDER